MRDRRRETALGALLACVFLVTWAGPLVFEWLDRATDARAHGTDPTISSGGTR